MKLETKFKIGNEIKYHCLVKNVNGEIEKDKYDFNKIIEIFIRILENEIIEYYVLEDDSIVTYDKDAKEYIKLTE